MTDQTSRRGLSTRGTEIAVALFTFAVGLLVTYGSYSLGARWGDDGPQAGYFPFYIGLFICIGSVANAVAAARFRDPQLDGVFVDWDGLRRVLSVLVPAALFVAGIQLIGIYASALVYIAGFMIWLGKYSWYRALAVGLSVSLVLYMMFEIWFQVPLPKGAYDPLFIIGR